ncbi:MAG TPA: peptidoglycan-binding protein [Burkholderiaceae bacterium]
MSRFLKSLSSLVNSDTPPASQGEHDAADARSDSGPSTLTTPLLPINAAARKAARGPSSRALNAVVRATTQVALPAQIEPTPAPKVTRPMHRSTVVLTETERLRLQIMQVQLKLTGLALYEGPIDGLMNRELVDGVRHFQTLKNMRNSGLLTAATLTALGIRAID